MPAIEIGRICVKVAGREAGYHCVIVDTIDKNFVLITGPRSLTGIKRKRVNVNHLEVTPDRVDIAKGESDENVAKALDAAGKTETMKAIERPRV
jgi:large subunit ribosomal protein L14e